MKIRIVFPVIILLLLLCLVLFFNNKAMYKFMYSEDEISCISLVYVTIGEEIEQKEQIAIHDVRGFLKDFRNVNCRTWWGDPIGLTEDGCVIRIDYQNGDYELVCWNGKAEYRHDRGFRNYCGYRIFDEEAFLALISAYQ